jgi:hypothetical protein
MVMMLSELTSAQPLVAAPVGRHAKIVSVTSIAVLIEENAFRRAS